MSGGPLDGLRGYPGGSQTVAVPDGLAAALDGCRAVLFTGSWCPDCRRFVPELRGVWDALGGRMDIEVVEMERGSRNERAAAAGVMAIPTLVLYRGDTELGRIIERTENGIADHLHDILAPSDK